MMCASFNLKEAVRIEDLDHDLVRFRGDAEGPAQVDPGALDRRFRLDDPLDRPEGHGEIGTVPAGRCLERW